ncbi:MAG: RDD family protein [Actinomycetota bacterium]
MPPTKQADASPSATTETPAEVARQTAAATGPARAAAADGPAGAALPRRLTALLTDLALVAGPTVAIAAAAAERFPILDDSGTRPRFDPLDQQRINEIDQGPNRALQLGDTVLTLSGSGLWLTVAALVILTALVFFAIPAVRNGQTPGRSLLRVPPTQTPTDGAAILQVTMVAGEPDEPSAQAESRPETDRPNRTVDTGPTEPTTATESELEPVTADPVNEPEPIIEPDPVNEPEPIIEPDPVNEPEPIIEVDARLPAPEPDQAPDQTPGAAVVDIDELERAEDGDASSAASPIWSERWSAWVYRDADTRRWFFHDETSGRWKPIPVDADRDRVS